MILINPLLIIVNCDNICNGVIHRFNLKQNISDLPGDRIRI